MIKLINSTLKTAGNIQNLSISGVISENSPKNVKKFKSLLFAAKTTQDDEKLKERIEFLIKSVLSRDENIRRDAIWELAEIGKPAVPYLIKTLNEKESENYFIKIAKLEVYLKSGICSTLGEMGQAAGSAGAALINIVNNSKDTFLRQVAVAALAEIKPANKKVVDGLIRVVSKKDEDAVLRRTSIWALAYIGPAAKDAIPLLDDIMKNNADNYFRIIAGWALYRIDPKLKKYVLPFIEKEFNVQDESFKTAAALVLAEIDYEGHKKTVNVLMKSLEDKNIETRIATAGILAKTTPRVRYIAVSELINLLEDKNIFIRRYTVKALDKLGATAKEAVLPLIILSRDKNENGYICRRAKEALKKIGPLPATDIPKLIAIINNSDGQENINTRIAAVYALAYMKSDAKGAVNFLKSVLFNEENTELRLAVIYALGEVGCVFEKTVPILFDVQTRSDWEVVNAARCELVKIGKPAVPYLARMLSRKGTPSRVCAAKTLSMMGKKAQGAMNELINAINYDVYSNTASREYAIEALGNIGKPAIKAVNKILGVVNNGDEYIDTRVAGVKALAKIVPNDTLTEDIVVKLFNRIINNPREDDELKDAIREVLKKWGRSL